MTKLNSFLSFLFLLFTTYAHGTLTGPLYSKHSGVSLFLEEAYNLLPPKFQEGLPNKIEVVFKQLDETTGLEDLRPFCDDTKESPKTFRKIVYGKNVINTEIWRTASDKKATIYLNIHLLKAIIDRETHSENTFSCRHQNFYKTAVATLIHELAHIYEHFNKNRSEEDKKFIKELYNLTSWNDTGFLDKKRRQTNINVHRSPDPFELKDKREAFPVNFEYFILDPEYGERLPTRFEHFAHYFDFTPFPHDPLKINRMVMVDTWDILNTEIKTKTLDPERLYQVHFLLSSKGGSPDEFVGHSMIRLVFCSKEHLPVGPHCLEDTEEHLVVSFMAYVNGIILNPIKGLTGQYTMKGVIESFDTLVEEYTVQYDRDLLSLNLEILKTFDDKVKFLNRLTEIQSSYASKYRYFSNNCTHETRNFLLQIFGINSPINHIYTAIPYQLMKQLYKKGVISEENYKNRKSKEAVKKELYLKSHRYILKKKIIPNFKRILKEKEKRMGMTFHDYFLKHQFKEDKIFIDLYLNGNLKKLSSIEPSIRLDHIVAIFSAFNEEDTWILPETRKNSDVYTEIGRYFIMIEEVLSGINSSILFKKIGDLSFAENIKEDSDDFKIKENFRAILDLKEKVFVKELKTRKGYGIPLKTELNTASEEQILLTLELDEKISLTKELISKKWEADYKTLAGNEYISQYLEQERYYEILKTFKK